MKKTEVIIESEDYSKTVVYLTDKNNIMIMQDNDHVFLPIKLVPEFIEALNALITP